MLKGYDIAGEGDVKSVDMRAKTLKELKDTVVENGWSGFTIAGNRCYFKHTVYHLKPDLCRKTNPDHKIYIYAHHKAIAPSTQGKWEFVAGKDIPG